MTESINELQKIMNEDFSEKRKLVRNNGLGLWKAM